MQASQLRHPFSQFNISATTSHICGYRNHSRLAGVGNYLRFPFMIFSIQHMMLNPGLGQIFAEEFRFLYRDSPDQNRSFLLI